MPETDWKPLTARTWPDFERLFGERGACGGCWCMWYRLTHRDYQAAKGAGAKALMKALADRQPAPGILLYTHGKAAGWCGLGPREDFARLKTSRVMAPVDDTPVWSIMCFFILKEARGHGHADRLIEAAKAFARAEGAKMLEAYPVDAGEKRLAATFSYMGISRSFEKAGFTECARRSPTRPVMRHALI